MEHSTPTFSHSELLELSADRANPTPQEVLNTLLCPEWGKTKQMYDWRNHVPRWLLTKWEGLSAEARLAVYLVTREAADTEDWDSELE